ncbi:phage holin, LLH family [Sporolactobacillus sp. CQH2019]|uniref:phage holin, LLH family n=1 Tax=Sporolactobacillus sp. CQH2019 TaxID=3023512 RepID=UPI0023678176|nr:phage holin, LLH family [Sporolactobacillus sp. CQH2019]MDD9149345.1 phage holin, LLH family [Sporolactobacillus sp. CQH2019]
MIINVTIIVMAVAALVFSLTGFIGVYSRLSVQQKQELDRLAGQAVSFIEQNANNSNIKVIGAEKLSQAVDFVASQVNGKLHTKFTPEQIQAAVQFAFDRSPLKKDVSDLVKKVEQR